MMAAESNWFADYAAALGLVQAHGFSLSYARAEIARQRRVADLRALALRLRERAELRRAARRDQVHG
jgi:hypothetical protein